MDEIKNLNLLQGLGLDSETSSIYMCLVKNLELTPLQISRITEIDRAKVYRRLEEMVKKGLVFEVIDANRRIYKLGNPNRLTELYKEKESQMAVLSSGISDLVENVNARSIQGFNQPGTKVLFYRGFDSIKQQIWNTLKAEKEIVGYTHRSSLELMGKDFYEQWAVAFNEKGLSVRDIISKSYVDRYKDNPKMRYVLPEIKNDQTRVLLDDTLSVQVQMDIYDGVVSYYSWTHGDIFGVEIYNDEIFEMQRQLFEIAWMTAVEVD
jgi:sugar-specific transcriptional regulator TrmB